MVYFSWVSSFAIVAYLKGPFTLTKSEHESEIFLWFLPLLDVNSKNPSGSDIVFRIRFH